MKEVLKKIVENEYILNDSSYNEFLLNNLDLLGNTDAEIRDDLAYIIFATWIEEGRIDTKVLKKVLHILLSDSFLFYKLESSDISFAVKRSFSVLILASIMEYDNDISFLDSSEIEIIFSKISEYILKEPIQDGYVNTIGWIHAAAHTADLLFQLMISKKTTTVIQCEISSLIVKIIHNTRQVFAYKEEVRLCRAIVNNCKSLSDEFVMQHFESVFSYNKSGDFLSDYVIGRNTLLYAESFYFFVKAFKKNALLDAIEKIISEKMYLPEIVENS